MPELELDVNKVLAHFIDIKSKDGKANFLKWWNDNKFKKEFGFPASEFRIIAIEIGKIGKRVLFKQLKDCIDKNHWSLNFIKVGICISELSDKGERDKVTSIRNRIYKNKGWKELNIVNMGSTGAIKGILNYLTNLRLKEYSQESITKEFERIIEEWEKITVFVSNESNKDEVKLRVKEKVVANPPLFFVFSYGSEANHHAYYAIAELNIEQIFQSKYIWDTWPRFDSVGTKIYMWTFDAIKA